MMKDQLVLGQHVYRSGELTLETVESALVARRRMSFFFFRRDTN